MFTLGCAALAVVATWIATRHGPGMSPDSVTYLSAARNLAAGHGYADFTGQALTTFPPGYPALVAVLHVLGLSIATGARLVNAVSFGAVVLLAGVLIRRHTSSRAVTLGATALVAVSPALINIASTAWSETLFSALVLAFLLALEDGIAPGTPARALGAAGVLAGLAFLVRYAGLSLLAVGALTIAAGAYRHGLRTVARRLGVFLGAGSVLPGLWILRNAASGSRFLLGPRVAAPESWRSFLDRFLGGVQGLFTPGGSIGNVAVVAVVLGVAALGLSAALTPHRTRRGTWWRSRLMPLVAYVVVYSGVVISAGKTAGASVDQRIAAPVYVPALILVVTLVDRLAVRAQAGGSQRRWVASAPAFALVAVLAYGGSSAVAFASQAWNDGRTPRGYTRQNSDRFQLVNSVETLSRRALVATNRPWTLFEATGREPIVASPGQVAPELALIPILVSQLASQSCTRPVYLAWFRSAAQWPFTPAQLSADLDLDLVQQLRDGALYSVQPKVPDCPRPLAAARQDTPDPGSS
ncbi:MAG TPA: hypothetical protein VLV81_10670 [Acidimicrobiia bacterium]|nr:hypothetical protein [Acidimicrobiia bacterium]